MISFFIMFRFALLFVIFTIIFPIFSGCTILSPSVNTSQNTNLHQNQTPTPTPSPSPSLPSNFTNDSISFSLLGDVYKKGFTFPSTKEEDHISESYEWVKGTQTVENWETLVTTHKLSPLAPEKPISAEIYAQNTASLNANKGAKILETSIINTEDARKSGVDTSNPPYLLVYAFLAEKPSDLTELSIQKIENLPEGKVSAFIYSEKIKIFSDEELQSFLNSPSYFKKREEVIFVKFPY